MKNFIFLIVLFFNFNSFSQVIFSEPFDESTNSTSGIDNVGGVSWVTSAPHSVNGSDYFKVVSGVLESRDVNGPATFTTGNIDVSSCANDLNISMDLWKYGEYWRL